MNSRCLDHINSRAKRDEVAEKFCAAPLVALAVIFALCLVGCGKKEAASPVDTKPFEAAIVEYCQSKGYGMKVASVDSVTVNGDTATVLCKMQEAEGTYGLTVKWEFIFHRAGTGWQVETHTAK